jgi:hypothetical protein
MPAVSRTPVSRLSSDYMTLRAPGNALAGRDITRGRTASCCLRLHVSFASKIESRSDAINHVSTAMLRYDAPPRGLPRPDAASIVL